MRGKKNPKYWRERTLEEYKRRLADLQRALVFSKVTGVEDDEQIIRDLNYLRDVMGLSSFPTPRKVIRRLRRKIQRIEAGIYKRRNSDR